jgi:plasmid stabilization system protein ParE
MTTVWSPQAIDDLAALRAYIEQGDPEAAHRVALHIVQNVETLLPNSPEMGRPDRVPGTRELVSCESSTVPVGGLRPFDETHLM